VIPPRQGGPADKTLPTPDPAQVQLIRSYGPGHFLIGNRDWRSPVLVTPTATTAWDVAHADELSLDNLAPLKSAPVPTELLVLGCGARAIFIAPDKRAARSASTMPRATSSRAVRGRMRIAAASAAAFDSSIDGACQASTLTGRR